MSDWERDNEHEGDHGVVTESKQKVKKPPLYRVLLHNDDYTTMEFVVYVLKTIFGKQDSEAQNIMMAVHRQGIGIAGVYTFEIAESKANRVIELARTNDYPLLCTVEED